MVSPVVATCPARPFVALNLISLLSRPGATLLHNSLCSSSNKKTVHLSAQSAFSICRAIISRRLSIFVSIAMLLPTCKSAKSALSFISFGMKDIFLEFNIGFSFSVFSLKAEIAAFKSLFSFVFINKLPFIKSSEISIFFSWYSTSPAQKRLIFCARALDDEFAIYFASFKRFTV